MRLPVKRRADGRDKNVTASLCAATPWTRALSVHALDRHSLLQLRPWPAGARHRLPDPAPVQVPAGPGGDLCGDECGAVQRRVLQSAYPGSVRVLARHGCRSSLWFDRLRSDRLWPAGAALGRGRRDSVRPRRRPAGRAEHTDARLAGSRSPRSAPPSLPVHLISIVAGAPEPHPVFCAAASVAAAMVTGRRPRPRNPAEDIERCLVGGGG